MKKLNDYLTVGTAASYLGVCKDTLRRWDAAGKLKARRHPVTGFRLYLKEELDALLYRVSDASGTASRRPKKRRKKAVKRAR